MLSGKRIYSKNRLYTIKGEITLVLKTDRPVLVVVVNLQK
jgi:hypothetical protein